MYLAAEAVTCFREVLQDLRLTASTIAALRRARIPEAAFPREVVSWEYRTKNVLAPAKLQVDGDLAILMDLSLRRHLEHELADLLQRHQLEHLDASQLTTENRAVTQAISRTLYDRGYAGVVFRSNLDLVPCVALFEGRGSAEIDGEIIRLTESIPPLTEVCADFGLTLATRP